MKTMSRATLSFFIICFTFIANDIVKYHFDFTTTVDSSPTKSNESGNKATVSSDHLSAEQTAILEQAYLIAKEDGHKDPEVLQGILLQESRAGRLKSYKVAGQEFGLKTNLRYYGIVQMKLSAARDVLKAYPELKEEFDIQTDTDEEVIANLILNDEFAISVASKYLIILNKRYHIAPGNNMIAAYNQGPRGSRKISDTSQFGYVKGVRDNIRQHAVATTAKL